MREVPRIDHGWPGRTVRDRELDLTPLGRGGGLRSRMRALTSNAMLVVALTLGVLMILSTGIGLLAVLLSGGDVDYGLVAVLAMFFLGGIYVVIDVFAKARTGTRLQELARVNDLELTSSLEARHYAGRDFRSGRRIIHHSVRTREVPVVEVGDSWPLTRIRVRMNAATHTVSAKNAPEAMLFLRAVLSGPVRTPLFFDSRSDSAHLAGVAARPSTFVTPAVDDALHGFAGDYTLEIIGNELTLMGGRPLELSSPDRVATAFALADALAARAEALLVDTARAHPAMTDPVTAAPRRGRRGRHPLAIVGAVLALMIIGPLGIAIVMSSIDDHLRGEEGLARLVVMIILAVLMGLVAAVMRWITARRRPARPERDGASVEGSGRRGRRVLLVVGALVVLVLVAVVTWFALSPGDGGSDSLEDLTSAAECASDDQQCQWEVSQRVWATEHGLTRPYPMVGDACELTGPDRSECHLYVDCGAGGSGEVALVAVYGGDPWVVIGVRPLNGPRDDVLVTADEEIDRIVAENCHG